MTRSDIQTTKSVLVTGATGFIGYHLVRRLVQNNVNVCCLVRKNSQLDELRKLNVELVFTSLMEPGDLYETIKGKEIVFHLAGLTKAIRTSDLFQVNLSGTKSLAKACSLVNDPPVLILVSSLAAAGPSWNGRARCESDPESPVSNYGKSKLGGEEAARQFSDRVPISIVRPPIVIGERDRDGFALFKGIATSRIHFVPTRHDHHFSLIHADDLVSSLLLIAERGGRVSQTDRSSGVYFVSDDMTPTFADLGRMIGRSVGRQSIYIKYTLPAMLWVVGGVAETWSRLTRKPLIMNLDKVREATAGSWTCCNDKIKQLGYKTEKSLEERIFETAKWYQQEKWI